MKVFLLFPLIIANAFLQGQDLKLARIEPTETLWRAYFDITTPPNQPPFVLHKEDVKIRVGDQWIDHPLDIQPFGETGENMSLVVVLDSSGSMKGQPLEDAKKAMIQFLDSLSDQDQIALMTFNDDADLIADFSTDHDAIGAALNEVEVGGQSSVLYKALYKGLTLFEREGLPDRKLLIVLSDGKDEGQAYRAGDVSQKSRDLQVPIYALGFSRVSLAYLDNLERMSDLTGGMYYKIADSSRMNEVFTTLHHFLGSQWVASFAPDLRPDAARIQTVTIQVQNAGLQMRSELELTLPQMANKPKAVQQTAPPAKTGNPQAKTASWRPLVAVLLLLCFFAAGGILAWLWYRASKRQKPNKPVPEVAAVGTKHFPMPTKELPSGRLVIENDRQQAAIPILEKETYIGGNQKCHVVIHDPKVSNFHAVLRWRKDAFYLIDDGSTNGTFIDDSRIHSESVLVVSGAAFDIGDTRVVFEGFTYS